MARFNLKSHQQDPALVLLVLRIRGERLVYSTGLHVPLKYWDVKRGRCKSPHLYRPGAAVNEVLDKIERACDAFRAEGMAAGGWDFDVLRKELDRITLRVVDIPFLTLPQFVREVIEKRKASLRPNTIKAYNTTLVHLEAWAKENRTSLPFEEVDMDFFYSWTKWLTGTGLNPNSVQKDVKKLKTFLLEAEQRGYPVPSAFKTKRFIVGSVPTAHIYLTEADLAKIEKANVDDRLDRVRDLLMAACRTGLRWSDWPQVTNENIRTVDGVDLLFVDTLKTGQMVSIPVHPRLRTVMEKWGGKLPLLSMQKFNLWVKELCQVAKVERADLVSSHTCRRTFATLAYKAGMQPLTIAKITGHSSERVLLAYIRVSIEENAVLASKNKFFEE